MPNVSQAQRGAMAEAEEGNSSLGIPKSVGTEFMNADTGGKLPEHVKNGKAVKVSRAAKRYSKKTVVPGK